MKIVQTFWTGNQEDSTFLGIKAGWTSAEYHWMSWALSCYTLRRHYQQVELYTNKLGKSILIDLLNLPYTKVHLTFDESFQIRPELFSLAKIKTYGVQEEPFIHVDGDVYIWKPFPDSFSRARLIASNLEKDLFFNKRILDAINDSSFLIPKHLEGIHKEKHIYACNAGIFGGGDLSFIKKYCDAAQTFISQNKKVLEQVDMAGLNWLIEQISLFYLSKLDKVPVSYLVESPVESPLYPDFWRFLDIPSVELVHPVGGCKKEDYVLDHLSKRLRLEFPDIYYKIIGQCQQQKQEVKNRFYSLVDVGDSKDILERQKLDFNQSGKQIKEQITEKSFKRAFKRTLSLIEKNHPVVLSDYSSLYTFMEKQKVQGQTKKISDVFELENHKFVMLGNLIQCSEKEKERMYFDDMFRYKKIANFFKRNSWMETNIKLVEGVKLLYYPKEGSLGGVISLAPNILNLDIKETQHDGFDAELLGRVGNGSIESLAISLTDCFEDEVTTDNEQYQQLLFDTIKRMAFENLVELQ